MYVHTLLVPVLQVQRNKVDCSVLLPIPIQLSYSQQGRLFGTTDTYTIILLAATLPEIIYKQNDDDTGRKYIFWVRQPSWPEIMTFLAPRLKWAPADQDQDPT
jgi:hypothetical protein